MSAREDVLARVRAALGPDRPAPPDVPRDYAGSTGATGVPGTGTLSLLVDRLEDYRAAVRRTTAADVVDTVAAAVRESGVQRVVVPPGLPPRWLEGLRAVTVLKDQPPLSLAELDGADGVLTGCRVAIAGTGTIVLDAGPDQGRRVLSLVPDWHLCVVRADQVVAGVPDGLARLDPRRPLTFISGPSATSDIELQRVEGVHGPRTLVVVLVEG